MQVIRGSRRRLTAFCALALVSMAIDPSRNPYHMATAWMDPSWLSVHMVIGRRSWRKASISSGDILIEIPLLDAVAHRLFGIVLLAHTDLLGRASGLRPTASSRWQRIGDGRRPGAE